MNKNAADITIVLDRSGSMDSIKDDIIGGYNTFLKQQREIPGECLISLIQFDSNDPHEVVYEGIPLLEAPELTGKTFVPRGGTPLLRAIDAAIDCTGSRLAARPEVERPEKVIFVIITDGEENASGSEYPKARIARKIEHQREKYKWQIVFLGTDFDAFAEAGGLNVTRSSTAAFHKSASGVAKTYGLMASSIGSYRSSLSADVSFTPEQQEDVAKE